MLSQVQMETYAEIVSEEPNVLPPRITTIPADQLKDLSAVQYGEGDVLYIGRELSDDDPLVDCDCGIPHVEYMVVRADGAISPSHVSGSLLEALLGPPTYWDDARPVEVTDWPSV